MTSNSARDFKTFFSDATGYAPYEWQVRVATEGLPPILPVPTGLGKTEGAVLAWAWRRLAVAHDSEPLHLVYCLPMRSLVRQTVERLTRYFGALEFKRGIAVRVHELMGGAIDDDWARWPDKPWVLVGTQDQLLSRALNRGYAMYRFDWPMHFGLLNQDCRWIVDEVQLMGPGLWTTAQLDWMRQKRFPGIKACPTTWMSATIGTGFLATIDRQRDGLDTVVPFDPRLDEDQNEELRRRLAAKRCVEWFEPNTGKSSQLVHEQIAAAAHHDHRKGTLTLIICNTVEMAQQVFQALPQITPKVLLTSRFRRKDRAQHEQKLIEFEAKRANKARQDGGNVDDEDLGLICVSTQVVEAGVDISAHQLWSEVAPWPSVIQRLGRLNRDGHDKDARAHFWKTPLSKGKKADNRIGPYERIDLDRSATLLNALIPLSTAHTFSEAAAAMATQHSVHSELIDKVLQPAPAPIVRALDVHGLFSTERDLHGGFTDVSAFVRDADPDADVTVFWRVWAGNAPPRGDGDTDALDGPELDVSVEGCSVAFFRLRDILKTRGDTAWAWNDENEKWKRVRPHDLYPGMVVMLHRNVGGYNFQLGWTGKQSDGLADVPRAGRGRALRNDERSETEYWARLEVHLRDMRNEAERICDALGLRDNDGHRNPYRASIVEAAALHDIGKAHPKWQDALPNDIRAVSGYADAPLAKFPRVLAVDGLADADAIRRAVALMRPNAVRLPAVPHQKHGTRLRWAIERQLSRSERDELRAIPGVRWAGHVPFRPGMRHEAASALAMWHRYREDDPPYPALAVYLAAAHHGKVRTILRAISGAGDDVFGVPRKPETIEAVGQQWSLDFSVAADGASGQWSEDRFILTDHGWTGLVADLLGPWRSQQDDGSDIGAVPKHEPRQLGPFLLAWLEALVRVADWRASAHPSESRTPAEVPNGG